jgi:GT2 family glycosyltransferase
MKNNIVAVVVTYNRKDILRECINRLLRQKEVPCDILIINNSSTDGTEEMIETEFSIKEVLYFNTGKNLGGAGGFEFGIGKAVRLGYEYIWIMDDDSLPTETALKELTNADNELLGKWSFLSSAVYWTDGTLCKANIPKKSLFSFVRKKEYEKHLVRVKVASFVSLYVKSQDVKEIGLPIGDYFIWTDDYEYTLRLSSKDRGYLVTDSKVIHAMKENKKVNLAIEGNDRIDRYKLLYRNDYHCYSKQGLEGYLYLFLKFVYTLLNVLVKSGEMRIKRIKILFKGYGNGIKFKPSIKSYKDI